MREPWDRHIAAAVEEVTESLATEVDPHEERWPTDGSLAPLRAELDEILQGAIADWLLEKRAAFVREAVKPVE